jgi:hypothetical protein
MIIYHARYQTRSGDLAAGCQDVSAIFSQLAGNFTNKFSNITLAWGMFQQYLVGRKDVSAILN